MQQLDLFVEVLNQLQAQASYQLLAINLRLQALQCGLQIIGIACA